MSFETTIEDWRNRPLTGEKYPYIHVDGIYLRWNGGREYENTAILVANAVNEDGYCEGGAFSDGKSALMRVCARLRHVAGTRWGNKKYMNMKHLEAAIWEHGSW